ncbi:MAG: glycosyltransferase [Mycobacterium sp.]
MSTAEFEPHTQARRVRRAVDEVCVVIPAHDEQDLLGDCLGSVLGAARELRRRDPQVRCHVIVVLDDCADASADIVTRSGAIAVEVHHQNVGAARRDGVRIALARSHSRPRQIWLASTDADCQVPIDWLTGFVDAADSGYHLVAGMVRASGELTPAEQWAWNQNHEYTEGHPHVHGANLGIRADVYARLGGWRALPTGEDVDLVRRAERLPGLPILRSARQPVATSFRRVGRAPSGFAEYLSSLAGTGGGA